MIPRQFIAAQLALIVWREAHHYGGHKPMVMIAHCIANRVRRWKNNWEWTFDHLAQFSAKNADEQKTTGWPHPMDVAWTRLLSEIDGIVEGTAPDPTNPERKPDGGAVYWADLNDITRSWFLETIARDPKEHQRVGNNGTLSCWT